MHRPHLPPHWRGTTHENAVTPAHEDQFERENAALARLLRRALDGAPPVAPPDRELRILDLACGPCREAATLVRTMADASGESVRPVKFVGADIRRREIEEAIARSKAAGLEHAEFLVGDCARLTEHGDIGADFDLTFLRHQNFWHDPAAWRRIFAHGLERLHEDGLLVITSYFDREHALAVKALEEAGAELVTSVRNDASIALPTPGKSVDRHLAVFRRRPARRP